MSSETFDILAARVLAGEATPQEQEELKSLLRDTPSLRPEWEALQEVWTLTRAVLPLAESARQTEPSLPEHRLEELRGAVHASGLRKKGKEGPGWFSRITWPAGAAVCVAVLVLMVAFPGAEPAVQIGMYQEEAVRGTAEPQVFGSGSDIEMISFGTDAQFDSWKAEPLKKGGPAKAWIDESTAELNLVFLNKAGEETHMTRSLPDDPAQRRAIIRDALQMVLPPGSN
jgi:hypothetical protein